MHILRPGGSQGVLLDRFRIALGHPEYTDKGAVLAIWEVWGASWGVSWGRPGGCSGAAKGLLGASLVRLGASRGPPGGLLGPFWGAKRPVEAC